MKHLAHVGAIFFAAGAALAQQGQTRLDVQVSTDGVTWAPTVSAMPGSLVLFRVRVDLIDGPPVLGFSGINIQPTVDGWIGSGPHPDRLLPFADTGSNSTTPSGSVVDQEGLPSPGQEQSFFGRIRPFGAPNVVATNRLIGQLDAGGTVLRIAQAPTTNPAGIGSGMNNVNGSGGVPISQSTGLFQPPPSFVPWPSGGQILKLGLRMSDEAPVVERILRVDIPMSGISLYGPNRDVRAGNWLVGHDPETGVPMFNYAEAVVYPAEIHVVPGTGVPMVCAAGLLCLSRRRRR